jgi:hypothetical protein
MLSWQLLKKFEGACETQRGSEQFRSSLKGMQAIVKVCASFRTEFRKRLSKV